MNISQRLKKLARATDFDTGRALRISSVEEIRVAGEERLVLWGDGEDSPIPLANDALRQLAKICDSEETNDWTGQWVYAFNDRNVTMNDKKVGGIRFRAASDADVEASKKLLANRAEKRDSDIPFA